MTHVLFLIATKLNTPCLIFIQYLVCKIMGFPMESLLLLGLGLLAWKLDDI